MIPVLPSPAQPLELTLTPPRGIHVWKAFEGKQSMDVVLLCEARDQTVLVVHHPFAQIVRAPEVQHRQPVIRQNVDVTVLHHGRPQGFASKFSLARASTDDVDSTVQEANIAYPSYAGLMTKLAGLGRKVVDFLKTKTRGLLPAGLAVDLKTVKTKARAYFFMSKNTDIEMRREVFKELHRLVKQQLRPIVEICNALDARRLGRLPRNVRRVIEQVRTQAWRHLLDVGHFTRTHRIKSRKILEFHAHAVTCIRKGKVGKENELGRVFQLGRIKGNFPSQATSNAKAA